MSIESFSEKYRAKVRTDVDGTMIVPGKLLHDHPRGGRPGLSIKSSGFAFLARRTGDDISESKPILDSRLPDGSRVAAVIPPCSLGGVTLTIRKFNTLYFEMENLVEAGTLTETPVLNSPGISLEIFRPLGCPPNRD
jgi:hypothetical protein